MALHQLRFVDHPMFMHRKTTKKMRDRVCRRDWIINHHHKNKRTTSLVELIAMAGEELGVEHFVASKKQTTRMNRDASSATATEQGAPFQICLMAYNPPWSEPLTGDEERIRP
ncbi:hypothetical protein E6O75_ATG05010 [Venturia nashicola]|uniref:Uncharacterized protein n=1 Tax=Venturia nashicola TaxID=86259 RepID=A0A4Z1PFD2_9PEZI|nr:hypothetical protein E6O75_ATG05010 [Venturia nashicola]